MRRLQASPSRFNDLAGGQVRTLNTDGKGCYNAHGLSPGVVLYHPYAVPSSIEALRHQFSL